MPDITRMFKSSKVRQMGLVACVGEKINIYMLLIGKTEGNRPL
jgi:hypothetical protein